MGILLGVIALTVAADLLTKQLAVAWLVEGRRYAVAPGVGLCRLHNERGNVARLSLLPAALMWLAIVACIAAAVLLTPAGLPAVTFAGLGLSVGGATGNLADRFLRGSVVDFVVAGRWRVFNLADAAIIAGLVVALASLATTGTP